MREHDTAEMLAVDFCDKHGIEDPIIREQLYKLLCMQLDGLLEKIDEKDEEFANQFSQTDMYSSMDGKVGSSAAKLGSRHSRHYSRGLLSTSNEAKSIVLSPIKASASMAAVNPVYS